MYESVMLIDNIMYTKKNMFSITLNKEVSCEYICSQIQKLFNAAKGQSSQELLLVVSINPISYTTDSLIPKIEYKE